ncbi:hypothetical protein E1A91_D08G071800v1 [Gossypium mustelinum]|uniref:Uncharacterized protein n=1 Tax=Gossypium mustelinum TaxID=34275 RepID=A0A5D2TVA5_GOSMU|nr:hypothetical protein E1A91_D08G071800v1 [Gossypium mustelinum]TYI68183.1 hypothetical protein E1A91_D08G071800v1 [Gossypium mustelinum]
MIPLPNSSVNPSIADFKKENRYKKLLSSVDLTKDFFFSYSYNVMCSLQKNLYNNEPVALVYGFFKQASFSISGRSFKLLLIARRSRHYELAKRASDFPREYDGECLQMRMSYSPATHRFLFLVQWTDYHLASALGLLRILIYKVYVDGTTTMSTHERKASIREFYGMMKMILLPR